MSNWKSAPLTFYNNKITCDETGSIFFDAEVMMDWEDPIMSASSAYITEGGGDILEVGFGMGISSNYIQSHNISSHTIIENHPQVIEKAIEWSKDKSNVTFVIPKEGTVVVPYVMSLVKNGPNPAKGKAILDFIMSDDGQKVWANAFLRPIRASAMSKEAASKFLPASDYARSKPLDYAKMAAVQNSFKERYLNEVR